jgi:YegS/Rv2252/BmrU family lipid kinase
MLNLIYNPIAGRGRAARSLAQVTELLERADRRYRVLTTDGPGHATELVEALPDDALVVAVGGDGTVHESALPCIGSDRTLGVIPVGSGDDFGFALGLDRLRVDASVATLLRAEVRTIDSGVVNGVPFVNAVGSGFDAEVATAVRRAPRPLKGFGAYLYAIMVSLGRLSLSEVEVEVDGERVFTGLSLLVSVQNGPRNGGSFLFAPDADLTDGSFEILVAGAVGRLGVLDLVPRVMRGQHLGRPKVHLFHGRRIAIRWQRPKPAHLEGELMEATVAYDIELRPASLRVFA